MTPASETSPPPKRCDPPLVLVAGEDEFTVKRRASQIFHQWTAVAGSFDHETIDADARTTSDALKALARLREAMQTLPFLGSTKKIWFRDCNFLAVERPPRPAVVTQSLAQLASDLRSFPWRDVRLLISAGRIDRRLALFAAIEEIGRAEIFDGLSATDKDWADQAEEFVRQELKPLNQQIDDDALAALVTAVGPNLRQLANELEKVSLHAGRRSTITAEDVAAVVTRRKQAQAFGLAEALGDRNLTAALRHLDEELWETRSQTDRSVVGLLYLLVSKLRIMLMIKELQRAGWVSPASTYQQFKARLLKIPPDLFPEDPRCNPLRSHAYSLFKASLQTRNYTTDELVNGMQTLLACNQTLVGSQLDEAAILQRALVQIIGTGCSLVASPRVSCPL